MIKAEFKNLSQFQARMKDLKVKIHETIETALESGAENIADRARERVPIKNGLLRESITAQKGGSNLNFLVEAKAPHARFVEYGTLKTPARPFFWPAFEEGKGLLRVGIIKAINEAVKG